MRTINLDMVGQDLIDLINEENLLDEDIGILDINGNLRGVIITKAAYDFFLEKIEEEEDRIDKETIEEFHVSGEKNQ